MLPDIRAIIAASFAAIGLLMIAFGAVATFRVAQQSHAGSLQADLASRGRTEPPATSRQRTVAVIETPGPHIAPLPPLPITVVKDVPVGARVSDTPVVRQLLPDTPAASEPREAPQTVAEAPPPPSAPQAESPAPPSPPLSVAAVPEPEPAIGGPLAQPKPEPSDAERTAAKAKQARKLAAAKKAREARLARQRRIAAARRAAIARARQQQPAQSATSFNNFGNTSFGWATERQAPAVR